MRPEPSLGRRAPWRVTGRTVLFACLAFFGTIAAMNAVMITLAVGSFPGLEVDSSYRVGLEYPEELAAARAQVKLAWQVTAHAERGADGATAVAVTVVDHGGVPVSGLAATALLKRPASADLDRTADLAAVGAGRYAGRAVDVTPGVYDLVVTLTGDDGRRFRSINRLMLAGDVP